MFREHILRTAGCQAYDLLTSTLLIYAKHNKYNILASAPPNKIHWANSIAQIRCFLIWLDASTASVCLCLHSPHSPLLLLWLFNLFAARVCCFVVCRAQNMTKVRLLFTLYSILFGCGRHLCSRVLAPYVYGWAGVGTGRQSLKSFANC